MRTLLALVLSIVMTGSLSQVMADDKPDPRLGKMTYIAPGTDSPEVEPEYGEVFFQFNVECRSSQADVIAAISAISGPLWEQIKKAVPASEASEMKASYWGQIGNISSEPATQIETITPDPKEKKEALTKARRVHKCTKQEVALTAEVPDIYKGSQRIGVKTSDLDWLEARVQELTKAKLDPGPSGVRVSISHEDGQVKGIDYRISTLTNQKLSEKLRDQAREVATGPNSEFENDKKVLRFNRAVPVGQYPTSPPNYGTQVGEPLQRGLAPRVTLTLPFRYRLYAKSTDLINTEEPEGEGPITFVTEGQATRDGDYVEATLILSSRCQETGPKASDAVEASANDLLKDLRAHQGERKATETDNIAAPLVTQPTTHTSGEPVEWDTATPGNVTKYFSECTGKVVDVPKDTVFTAPTFWQASQTFTVHTSQFEKILNLIDQLQERYGKSSVDQKRVKLTVRTEGKASDKIRFATFLDARRKIVDCIADPNGSLMHSIEGDNYTCGYLNELVPTNSLVNSDMALRSFAPSAGGASPMSATLPVELVPRLGSERPKVRVRGTYFAFVYEYRTKNYKKAKQ